MGVKIRLLNIHKENPSTCITSRNIRNKIFGRGVKTRRCSLGGEQGTSDFTRSVLRISPASRTPPRRGHQKRERERERMNISLIYITRLFQSNIAIHQRGFQWQAITSSACCCCCSLGPQLPNSPWKNNIYIFIKFSLNTCPAVKQSHI